MQTGRLIRGSGCLRLVTRSPAQPINNSMTHSQESPHRTQRESKLRINTNRKMVQTKHQKSKPKKQQPARNKGKEGDMGEFHGQLDALGLKIVQVTADDVIIGRALADQLEGDEEVHQKYRDMVVKFIEKNREMFEPFVEDEVPFDNYCRSMEKDGTWAGHMEIQAVSLVTHSNICIHRNMSPRWYIRNFNDSEARMVHLSYHDGEHYNSVRLKEDNCAGPARPISIKADAGLSATSLREKATPSKSSTEYGSSVISEGSIKLVKAGSGLSDDKKIKQVLLQVNGDTDAAIEFLIAEQQADELQSERDPAFEVSDANICINPPLSCDNSTDQIKTLSSSGPSRDNDKLEQDSKKTPRNKACPCGSKKKYKSCCGTATVKASMQFPVAKSSSGRKDKKQGKKSANLKATTTGSPEDRPLDVGALCI